MNIQGIENYIEEINKIAGIISVTIVSTENGEILVYDSKDKAIDNQLSASFQVEVLRQITRGLNYVDGLENKEIKDLIVTLEEQVHFVFTSDSKEFVIHIIGDSKQTNIGLVKMLHNKIKASVE